MTFWLGRDGKWCGVLTLLTDLNAVRGIMTDRGLTGWESGRCICTYGENMVVDTFWAPPWTFASLGNVRPGNFGQFIKDTRTRDATDISFGDLSSLLLPVLYNIVLALPSGIILSTL
jgi:hypothetical protein